MTETRAFDGSDEDVSLVSTLWQDVFPAWPIPQDRLARVLKHESGNHIIHPYGFCISYMSGNDEGKIACVGVLKENRRKGHGTSLIKAACSAMESRVPAGTKIRCQIDSGFPRFWPGVPKEFMPEAQGFFENLGFQLSKDTPPQDYYRSISTSIATPEVLERVSKLPLTFSPWSPELYEECMSKQRANFHRNPGWILVYELAHLQNLHHEVMVAFNASGQQVGWTIMASPSTLLCENFTFLPLCPSKDKTGIICCVGIDESARGQGAGLALIVNAMQNMKERGMEGVLIDSVVIRGFYEGLGCEVIWEYGKFEHMQLNNT